MTIGDPAALIPPPPVGDELPKWMQPRVPDDYKPFALPARLCCIMQKGGSGKSTTAGCLACELALMGFRVRLWDVDAQRGGVSHWFPPQHNYGPGEPPNLLHLFRGEATPDEVTYATRVPNLYIVPSYTSLKQVELGPPPGVENVINEGIENTTEHEIDFEIMDCGPSLGQLSIAATVAAPDVIIPFKASGFDLDSLQELNRTLGLVKKRLRPDMRVVAVLLSEVLKSNLAVDVFDGMCADYPDAIVMGIRQSVKAREAPLESIRLPLHEYAPEATVRLDFQYLAKMFTGRREAA